MNSKSIKFNFFMNLILTVSNAVFPLITFPYIARVLQPINNGKLAFCTSVVAYFSMIAMVGIPTYGIREVAKVRDDKEKLSKLVYEILGINIIITFLTLIVYMFMIFLIPKFYIEKELFFINGIGIILNTLGVNWLYSGLEQYEYITIRSIVFKILSVILMFIFVSQPNDYIIYGAITIIASSGSNLLNFFNMKKFIDLKKYSNLNYRRHLKPILIFFATSLSINVYTNLDTVMLGFLINDYAVGLYSTAIKIRTVVLSIVTTLGTVILPRLSYYVEKELWKQFKEIVVKSFNFIFLISSSICIFIVIYSKECIYFLAGQEYNDAIPILQIVIFTIIIVGISNLTGIQILTPMGNERKVLYSIICGALIDFILNLLLIPLCGGKGAAIATLIAEIIVLAVQCYYLKNFIREIFKNLIILKYIILTSFVSIVAIIFKTYFAFNIFINLFVGAIVYFGIGLILLIITKDQFYEMGKEIIRKRIKK